MADQIGAMPPAHIDSEKAVLGAMMIDVEALPLASSQLQAGDFYDERHQRIFRALLDMLKSQCGVDHILLTERLKATGELEGTGGEVYLIDLAVAACGRATLGGHIEIIQTAAHHRQIIEVAARMRADVDSGRPPAKTVDSVIRQLADVVGSSPPPLIGKAEQENISFKPVGLAELLQDTPDVEFLVEGILPVGRMMLLSGLSGEGKTWLSLDLALSVAQGSRWLGHYACRQGKVLVIDEESGHVLLKKRLSRLMSAAGIEEDDSACDVRFLSMAGVNLSNAQCVASIKRMLEEEQFALIIIDTLIRVHRENESSSEEMARVSEVLQALCNDYGCALWIDHHNRKPGLGRHDSQHAYRGSTEIQALVDSHLDLKAVKGETGLLNVQHVKSRFAEPVEAFGVEIVDVGEGTVVGHTEVRQAKTQVKQDEATEFIRTLISDGTRLLRKDLVEKGKAAGHAQNTLDSARKSMVGSGELIEGKDGNQRYVLSRTFSSSAISIEEEEKMQTNAPKENDLIEVRV